MRFHRPCLMGKSLRHISDSELEIPEDFSFHVTELENAFCNQDKLLCKVFRENKKLNLELENAFSKVVSLRSTHDDMSTKPCENCTMIMVTYVDLWLMHSHVARLLGGARLELRELKARSLLWVLALVARCLDLIWRLVPLRLKMLSTNLTILLTTPF
jgi:hypothetical protein